MKWCPLPHGKGSAGAAAAVHPDVEEASAVVVDEIGAPHDGEAEGAPRRVGGDDATVSMPRPAADDLDVDVPPPALTRMLLRFREDRRERDFRDGLRDEFIAGLLHLGVVATVLTLGVVGLPIASGQPIFVENFAFDLLMLALNVTVICVSLFARRSETVPLAVLEWLSVVWLGVAWNLRLVVFFGGRMELLAGRSLPEHRGTLHSALTRSIAIVFVAGLFIPLDMAPFLAIAACAAAGIVAGEAIIPSASSTLVSNTDVAIYLALLVTAAVAVRKRSRTDRGKHHFRGELIARAREWRDARKGELVAQLRATTAEVATSARAKLIRVVMHDLRSPLLAVRNMADAIAELPDTTQLSHAHVRRAVDALQTCTTLMEGIVSDMLDFERIDSGRMQLSVESFSLRRLLGDADLSFAPLAQRRSVSLVAASLPAALDGVCFSGDRRRLLQCIGNGLSNAIKFSEAGQRVTLSAHLALPADASADGLAELCVRVVDEGVGMTADELDVLRQGDAFAQVGKGQMQGNGGTGLGLNIVRAILDLHNGSSLSLHSDGHGRGTTFEMRLRLSPAEPAPSPWAAGSARASAADGGAPVAAVPRPPGAPVRCLHVEDDEMLQMTLGARLFSRPGLECDVAKDGQVALEAVEARGLRAYDIIVMDNQMPRCGGEEATRRLRALGYRGLIIGMTGDPVGSPDRATFEDAGLTECTDKTLEGMEVVSTYIDRLMMLTLAAGAGAGGS